MVILTQIIDSFGHFFLQLFFISHKVVFLFQPCNILEICDQIHNMYLEWSLTFFIGNYLVEMQKYWTTYVTCFTLFYG